MNDFSEIFAALARVLPQEERTFPLHEPLFAENELKYTKDCIETGWVSSVGSYVDKFELELAKFTGAKRAIAVSNGTAALHICLILAGVEAGDEVLIPALTFVATANAVTYCGATPHLVDSDIKTLGIDPKKLESYLAKNTGTKNGYTYNKKTGAKISAIIPMHTFGHPVDIDALIAICAKYNLEMIEDAAESLGSYYNSRHTGSIAKLAALSFNGNKIITTGGGGAILTNDEKLGERAKHLTTTAKQPHAWEYVHDEIGYNYRLPNLNAALGCAQLEQLPFYIKCKRSLAEKYLESFSKVDGVKIFREPEFAKSNYWLNALLIDKPNRALRNQILTALHAKKILARPAWALMDKLEMFKNCPKMDLSTAENISDRLINLPSSVNLGMKS